MNIGVEKMYNNDIVENLISLYGNDVLRIATAYSHDSSIAEDIFQEVFIKVANNLHKFENRSSEKTWIIRITINTCKDYLKSSWKQKVIPMEEIESNQSYHLEDEILKEENAELIIQEILKLPIKYKEILLLYYYQDLLTSDIAKILKLPEASVRTRLRRARDIIKNKLKIILED